MRENTNLVLLNRGAPPTRIRLLGAGGRGGIIEMCDCVTCDCVT